MAPIYCFEGFSFAGIETLTPQFSKILALRRNVGCLLFCNEIFMTNDIALLFHLGHDNRVNKD